MLYMIIERFHPGKAKEIYQRIEEKGRMLPYGVQYNDSWINTDVTICYQVMEADSRTHLQEWVANWNNLAEFEIIPVINSAGAKKRMVEDFI